MLLAFYSPKITAFYGYVNYKHEEGENNHNN